MLFSNKKNKFHTYLKSLAFDNIDNDLQQNQRSLLMVKMAQKICLIYDTNGVRKSGLNHGMALLQRFNMKLNKKCLLEFQLKSKLLSFFSAASR